MEALRYDESSNREALGLLSPPLRVAFALLCASRLTYAYEHFCERTGRGNAVAFRAAFERLWLDALGVEAMTVTEVADTAELCMRLVPSEEDGWDEETQPYAEDAAAALAYAARARMTNDPQEAAWAARRVYEAVDRWVLVETGLPVGDASRERAIQQHPRIQAELSRQKRDLAELGMGDGRIDPSRLEEMRQRSRAESACPFGGMA